MRRLFFPLVWRACVLPQFVATFLFTWGVGRAVAEQLRNGGVASAGCISFSLLETVPMMSLGVLTLAMMIGLVARKRWARMAYAVWSLGFLWLVAGDLLNTWREGSWWWSDFVMAGLGVLCVVTAVVSYSRRYLVSTEAA